MATTPIGRPPSGEKLPLELQDKHKAQIRESREIQKAQRHNQALELRKAGATYQQIADALGVSVPTAAKWVKQSIQAMVKEPAEELRILQLERLNTMLMVIWGEVRNGHLPAIDRALRIMGDQRALMGLDQVQVEKREEVRVQINTSPDDYIQALKEVQRAREEEKRREREEAGVIDLTPITEEETPDETP